MTAPLRSSASGTPPDAAALGAGLHTDLALANDLELTSTTVTSSPDAFSTPPSALVPRRRMTPDTLRGARALAGLAIAVGVWAAVTGAGLVDPEVFPSVPALAAALASSWPELLRSVVATLASWALGITLGTALGIIFGVVVGRFYWVDAAVDTIVRMFRPLPSLALIPIAVLVAGLGIRMTASLVTFATFWPIFISTRYAVRQIETQYLDSGRAVGLTGWHLMRWVIAPAITPAVLTGIRVAVSIGIVVTVSVQLVAGTGGLGGYVAAAQVNGRPDEVFVGIAAGGVLGIALNGLFLAVTRHFLPWSAVQRGGG